MSMCKDLQAELEAPADLCGFSKGGIAGTIAHAHALGDDDAMEGAA